ncbi:hypothetical protein ABZZ36_18300 [Actinacidiphila glaucinigra]|uniref:hypothetical protein n=1 Tax=Actinacidiphila glaucinigra TaxID=235986 RepID=UPI0033ACB4B1
MADLVTPEGVPASTLPPDVQALIEAIFDAVDVPLPAETAWDIAAHNQLIGARAADVRIQLGSLLRNPGLFTLAEIAQHLRSWTADSPVTYQPRDGGQA